MFRKSILICVLAICMVTFMGNGAKAQQAPTFSGWPYCWVCGSICAEQVLKKVQLSKTYVILEMRLANPTVQLWCVNPGGQDGGLGTAFFPGGEVFGSETLTKFNLIKSGKALADIKFTDEVLFDGFIGDPLNLPDGICPNPNWTVKVPGVDDDAIFNVLEMDIILLAWYQPDGGPAYAVSEFHAFHATLDDGEYLLAPCVAGDPPIGMVPEDPNYVWGGCGYGFTYVEPE